MSAALGRADSVARRSWASHARLAAVVVAAATVLSALRLGQIGLGAFGPATDWGGAVRSQVAFWYGWALVAAPLVRVLERLPFERATWPRFVAIHLALIAVALLVQPTVQGVFHHLLHPAGTAPFGTLYRQAVLGQLMNNVQVAGAVIGVTHAVGYYRRYRERELAAARLEAQLVGARLRALRAQLNPHFLFNSLNSVAMLSRVGAHDEAVSMLAGLGDLLRFVLDDDRPALVPLTSEVDLIRRYLEIEAIRFRGRLEVSIEVAPETETVLVPTLLLQPIVENAIRHGVARQPGVGRITVEARRVGAMVEISVSDNGPAPATSDSTNGRGPTHPEGLGLRITRERLEQHFPAAHRLELRSTAAGATVHIALPADHGDGGGP